MSSSQIIQLPTRQHQLHITPHVRTGADLMAAVLAQHLQETEEASEDITVTRDGDTITVGAWWTDREWCETLAEALGETFPGTHCRITHRNEQNR